MYKHEVKLELSQTKIVTTLVLAGFILAISLLPNIQFNQKASEIDDQQEIFAVDLDISSQINKKNTDLQADASYAELNPDLLMLKLRSEKYVSSSNFDSFLKKLSTLSVKKVDLNKIKTSKVGLTKKKIQSSSSINYKAFTAKNDLENKEINYKDLKSVISKNYTSFQKCYESTLIKDELLSGNASIILKVGQNAKVQFKGVGQAKFKRELESCLATTATKISFPSNYNGNKIKFSLFFNS